MPYLTRQEIIDQFHFDPLEVADPNATSIHSKTPKEGQEFSNEEIEAIRIEPAEIAEQDPGRTSSGLPDDKPIEPGETKETPSAPVVPMAASGALRGFISDPLLLTGMAIAGLEAAFTDKTFAQSLYKEGGLERVQQHLQDFANNLPADLEPEEKKTKLRQYQASPEFFQYHVSEMGDVYGSGMKTAAFSNGLFGIAKNPDQETWQDDAAQILGSVLIPSPGLVHKVTTKLAMATGKATPKIADLAAKAIDAVVLPGTSTKAYTPGTLAAGTGVGVGINEVVRNVTDEPSVARGDAFTPRLEEGGYADPNSVDSSPRVAETALGVGGLLTAGALAARAFRGKIDPNLNPIQAGPSGPEQINANALDMGIEPPADPSLAARISSALNIDAEIERQARDAGDRAVTEAEKAGTVPNVTADHLEREVQTATGLFTSRPARDAKIENAIERGEMPDGQRNSITLREILDTAQRATKESVDRFIYGFVARNVGDSRLKGLHESEAEVAKWQTKLESAQRNRAAYTRQQEIDVELQKRIVSHQAKLLDYEKTRPQLQGWDDAKVLKYQEDMMADPVAAKLHDMAVRLNTEYNSTAYRNGVISKDTYEERMKTPWHTALFEARGNRYLDKEGRETTIDPFALSVVPNQVIDPFQSLALKTAMLVDSISLNQGKWRVINALKSADPDGYYIRESKDIGRNTVTVLDGGRERHFEFSRASVAEALRFAPLSFGSIVQSANTVRGWIQKLTTGPWLGGIPTAVNSLAYDVAAGYTTRREGRAFGYLGMAARMIRGTDNKYVNSLADALDLANIPITVANQALVASVYKTVDKVGQAIADAAMGKGAFAFARGIVPDQTLRDVGGRMARAYEHSTVGILRRAGALQPHAMMKDTFGAKNRLEKYLVHSRNAEIPTTTKGKITQPIKNALRMAAEPYLGLIDTIHNAGRYAFFANNYSLLQHKYGRGGVPKAELERLVEETRRLAGDIQGVGGSDTYNKAMAFIPYGNISAQATRHLLHAAFSQGSKHSVDVGARMIGLGVAGVGTVKLMEEMGAEDWYWNTLNGFERVGSIFLPSPEAIGHKVTTGKWPEFNPQKPDENFMKIRLAAELVPWVQAIMAGMEGVGWFDRGTNLGKQTKMGDFMLGVAGAINVGNIPLVNMASLLGGGPKLDFINPLRGRPVAQSISGPRGEGLHEGETPGGISVFVQEWFKSVAGLAGDVAIAMTDAGFQKLEKGAGIFDALARAGEEGFNRLVTERMPSVPGLWRGESKVYSSTPTGARIRQVEELNREIDKQYSVQYGKRRMNYPESPLIQDPRANAMMITTHKFLSEGAYKKYSTMLTGMQAKILQLDAKKGSLSPSEIQVEKRKLQMQVRAQQEQLLGLIERHDQTLKRTFGDVFLKYNEEPTIEGARRLLERLSKKKVAA